MASALGAPIVTRERRLQSRSPVIRADKLYFGQYVSCDRAQHPYIFAADGVILRPETVDEPGWALLLVIPFMLVVSMIGSSLVKCRDGGGTFLSTFPKGQRYRGSALMAVLWWTCAAAAVHRLGVPSDGYFFLPSSQKAPQSTSAFTFLCAPVNASCSRTGIMRAMRHF